VGDSNFHAVPSFSDEEPLDPEVTGLTG
jgi:hypothetical protein